MAFIFENLVLLLLIQFLRIVVVVEDDSSDRLGDVGEDVLDGAQRRRRTFRRRFGRPVRTFHRRTFRQPLVGGSGREGGPRRKIVSSQTIC